MLLDWETSKTAFFVDGRYIVTNNFFSFDRDVAKDCDLKFINALMLYTLTPGVESTFKEIRLCTDLCPGTQESDLPLLDALAAG